MATQIGRLLTAMVTPFDSEGRVDYAQARKLALALVASGSDGVVVAGTTGESPTLTPEEQTRLFAEIKEALDGEGDVVAGTGSNSTAEAVKYTEDATKVGADAVLSVVPYYNKPPQEGLYRHFKAIAESTDLPVILYNVTSRTAINMSADTVIRLSEIPNIVGIKEAGGDLGQAAHIIRDARPGFLVWSGKRRSDVSDDGDGRLRHHQRRVTPRRRPDQGDDGPDAGGGPGARGGGAPPVASPLSGPLCTGKPHPGEVRCK